MDQSNKAPEQGSPQSSQDSPQPDRLGDLNQAFEGKVDKGKAYEEFRKNLFGPKPKDDQDPSGSLEGQPKESTKRPSAKRKQVSAEPRQAQEQKDVASEGTGTKEPDEEPKPKTERESAMLARIAKNEAVSKKRIEKELVRLSEEKQRMAQDMQAVDYIKQSIELMHKGDIHGGLKRIGQLAGVDTSYEGLTSAAISGKLQKARPDEETEYVGKLQGYIGQLEQRLAGLEQQFSQTHEQAHEAKVESYWSQAKSVLDKPEYIHAKAYADQTGMELHELLGQFVGQVVRDRRELPDPEEAAQMLEDKVKAYHDYVRSLYGQQQSNGLKGPPPKRMYEPFSSDEATGSIGTSQIPQDLMTDPSDDGMRKRARLAIQMIRQGKMPA